MRRKWKRLGETLSPSLRSLLAETLLQYRLVGLIGAVGLAACALLWVGLLLVALDWMFEFTTPARRLLRLAWLAAGAAPAAALLAARLRPMDPVRWALFVEGLAGGMEGELATAVELALGASPHPFSPALQRRVEARLGRLASPPEAPVGVLKAAAAVSLAGALAASVFLAAGRERFVRGVERLVFPGEPTPPPGGLVIAEVRPGDAQVPAGGRLEASCRMEGGGRKEEVFLVYLPGSGGPEERFAAREDGGRFLASTGPLEESGRYFFEVPGKARSADFAVRVLEPPEVEDVRFRVKPPAYTGRLPYEMGPDVVVLEGSEALVRVKTSRAAASGEIVMRPGGTVPLRPVPGGLEGRIEVPGTASYTVSFLDLSGLSSSPWPEHEITLRSDLPPEVRLVEPSPGPVLEGSDVPVRLRASDDFGIETLRIEIARQDGKTFSVSLRPPDGPGPVSAAVPAELVHPAGSSITVRAYAADNCPFRLQEARSRPVSLRIVRRLPEPAPPPPAVPSPEEIEKTVRTIETLLAKDLRTPLSDPSRPELERAFRDAAAGLRDQASRVRDAELAAAMSDLAAAVLARGKRRSAPGLAARVLSLLHRPASREQERPRPPARPASAAAAGPEDVRELPDPPDLSHGYKKLLEIYRRLLPLSKRPDKMDSSRP